MRLVESFHMHYTMLQNTLLVTTLKRFTENIGFVVPLRLGVFGCSFHTRTKGYDTLDQVGRLGSFCILHMKANGFDTLAPFGHLESRKGS